jgi:glycosyltransferase involved in cell wall biosynthesis
LVARCSVAFLRYNDNFNNVSQSENYSADIVVAAKNEAANISAFLDRIKKQTLSHCHLILVDDNSTDNTYQLVKQSNERNITLLRNIGSGKKSALKYGILHSTAPYIFSTDADCLVENQWAQSLVSAAISNDADMIMAPVIIEAYNNQSIFQRLWQAESFALITITAGTCILGHPVMCNGGNIGYSASFLKKSLSDINSKYASGDDMFMMESAERQHKKIVYVKSPKAVVATKGVQNLSELLNQRARWVSKTGGYTDSYIIFFALAILLGNISAILSLILSIFSEVSWWSTFLLLTLKFAADYASVYVSSEYYGHHQRFVDVLILGIVYPYYVVASVVTYFICGFKWK